MTGHHHAAQTDWDTDQFTTWLTESCTRQGVAITIHDPQVIRHVVTLLGKTPATDSYAKPPAGHNRAA
jgi:hypothetical protein